MPPAYSAFLPPEIDLKSVQACLGLISDTHMPQRCATLPDAIQDVFREVTLILHAGDVGELWVLDQLSMIAPVLAVHGNDEAPATQHELPYQQLITIGGQRILLCHTHDPDRETELELRLTDGWQPKLDRWVDFTDRSESSVLVFGHTHIPMTHRQADVLLVNPGAIASGSAVSRQLQQTVALLYILFDQPPVVVHVDLKSPKQPFLPDIDWNAGFRAALDRFSGTLIHPDLMESWVPFEAKVRKLLHTPDTKIAFDILLVPLLKVAHRCWADEQEYITRVDIVAILDEAGKDPAMPSQFIADLREILDS
jgi:uncharacterized protein